jgi:hypothetical protein
LEAFPWNAAPTYLVRDNDRSYGQAFHASTSDDGDTRPPDLTKVAHIVIYRERHLRRVLTLYSLYYNETRTHLALGKDAPLRRAVQGSGTIIATPILFGLHRRYARI